MFQSSAHQRVRRKPPPDFPFSEKYPPFDPTDPLAPLSVLRDRTRTSNATPAPSGNSSESDLSVWLRHHDASPGSLHQREKDYASDQDVPLQRQSHYSHRRRSQSVLLPPAAPVATPGSVGSSSDGHGHAPAQLDYLTYIRPPHHPHHLHHPHHPLAFNPRLSVVPGSPAVPGSPPPAMTTDDSSGSAGSLYSPPRTHDAHVHAHAHAVAHEAERERTKPVPMPHPEHRRTPSVESDRSSRSFAKRISQVFPLRRRSRSRSPSVQSRDSAGPSSVQVAAAESQMLRGASNNSEGSKQSHGHANRLSRIFIRPRTTSSSNNQGSLGRRDRDRDSAGGSARRKSQFIVPATRLEDVFVPPSTSREHVQVPVISQITDGPLTQSPQEQLDVQVRRLEQSEPEDSSSSVGDQGRPAPSAERRRPTRRAPTTSSYSSSLDAVTARVQGLQPSQPSVPTTDQYSLQGQIARRAVRTNAEKGSDVDSRTTAAAIVPSLPRAAIASEVETSQNRTTEPPRPQPPATTSLAPPPVQTPAAPVQPPILRTFLVPPDPIPEPATNAKAAETTVVERRTAATPAHLSGWRASIARHHRDPPPAPSPVPAPAPASQLVATLAPPPRSRNPGSLIRSSSNQPQIQAASGLGSSSVDVSSAGETTDGPPILIPPPQSRFVSLPPTRQARTAGIRDQTRVLNAQRDSEATLVEPSPLLLAPLPERPISPAPREPERRQEPVLASSPPTSTRPRTQDQVNARSVSPPERPSSTRPHERSERLAPTRPQEIRPLGTTAPIPIPPRERRTVEEPGSTPSSTLPQSTPSSNESQSVRPTVAAPVPQRGVRNVRVERAAPAELAPVARASERPSSPPPREFRYGLGVTTAQRDATQAVVAPPAQEPMEPRPVPPPQRPVSPHNQRYVGPGGRSPSTERDITPVVSQPRPQRVASPPPQDRPPFRVAPATPYTSVLADAPRHAQQSIPAAAEPPPQRPSSPPPAVQYRMGNDSRVLNFQNERNGDLRDQALSPILMEAQLQRSVTPRPSEDANTAPSLTRPDMSQQQLFSDSEGPDRSVQPVQRPGSRSQQRPPPPAKEYSTPRPPATTNISLDSSTPAARYAANQRRGQAIDSSPDVRAQPTPPQRAMSPPPQPDRSRKPTTFVRPASPTRHATQSDQDEPVVPPREQSRMRRVPPPASSRNAPSTPSRTISTQNLYPSQASTPMIYHPPMPTRPSDESPLPQPPPVVPSQSAHSYNLHPHRHATVAGLPDRSLPARPRTPLRAATAPIPITHPAVQSRVRFDEHRKPSHEQLSYAAESLFVVSENGIRVPFGDLWRERKTIVCFIRHFWCPHDQDYMHSVARNVDPITLKRAGVDLIFVGNGSAAMIKSYRHIWKLPFSVYTDPSCRLYEALGMTLRTNDPGPEFQRGEYIRHGLVGGIAMVVVHALRVGMPVFEKGGDAMQLGGEFILGPGLTCDFAHRMRTTRSHTPIAQILAAAGASPRAPARRRERHETLEHPEEQQIIQMVRNSIAPDMHLLPEPELDAGLTTSPSSPDARSVPSPVPPPVSEPDSRPRPRPRKTGSSERREEVRPNLRPHHTGSSERHEEARPSLRPHHTGSSERREELRSDSRQQRQPPDPRRGTQRYDDSTISRARQPHMQQSPPDVPEDDETDSDDRPQTRGHNKLQQRRTRRKPGRRDAEGPDISTQPQGHVTRERGGSTSDGRRRLERPRIEREEDSWGMNQNPNAQQYPQRGQRERDDYRPTDHGAQSDREYYQRPPVLRGDSKQRMQAQRQPPRRERDVEKYQIGSDDELEIANMYKQALILS